MLVERGLSERRSIRHMRFKRSTMRYKAMPESELNRELRALLRRLSERRRRWGSPMMTGVLKRRGYRVNHKRIERMWREERLTLPRRKPRRRQTGTPPEQRPKPPTGPNEVWAYDFMHDRTAYGQKVRILTITDEFTRESLELRVGWRMSGRSVMETLDQLFSERGRPRYVRSDNGAEFRNRELVRWLSQMGVTPIYIDPGCPWQNGVAESLHSRLREECLNQEVFYSRAECQVLLDWYREDYNRNRPHSSLSYVTPREFANMYSSGRQN